MMSDCVRTFCKEDVFCHDAWAVKADSSKWSPEAKVSHRESRLESVPRFLQIRGTYRLQPL
jgi:hypothetical protein